MTVDLRARGVRVVVLDIEGTTTPLQFVHDVLFPYARAQLERYVQVDGDPLAVRNIGDLLVREWNADVREGDIPPRWREASEAERSESIVAYSNWLMDRDRKSPGLKLLQGLIWQRGYREGTLEGEVFPDVPGALARWRAGDVDVVIYSSGSELAQQQLFASTPHGDLTRFMTGFFDTRVGAKVESTSYAQIARAVKRRESEMLFISDIPAELDAARAAGVQVLLCQRPGNREVPDAARFDAVRSFDEIVV